jgi:hypothetical protein
MVKSKESLRVVVIDASMTGILCSIRLSRRHGMNNTNPTKEIPNGDEPRVDRTNLCSIDL